MGNLQSSLLWKNTDTSFAAEEYSGAEGELKTFWNTPLFKMLLISEGSEILQGNITASFSSNSQTGLSTTQAGK